MTKVKSRQVFVLLASLATDPRTQRRDALAARLWPESPNSRANLRPVLSALRALLGPDALLDDGITLALRPDLLVTDLQRITALRDRAMASATPEERVSLLRDAAHLLNGDFLEGYEPPCDGDGWFALQRRLAQELATEIWRLLADACEAAGDSRGAIQARRAVLGVEAVPPPSTDWDTLLRHLAAVAREGKTLTVPEEKIVLSALARRLNELPDGGAALFRRLSVFPQSFTARQAECITDAGEPRLREWEERGLIHLVPAGVPRWELPPLLRAVVWKSLSRDQRQRCVARHAAYFLRFEGYDSIETVDTSVREEKASYLQTLAECLNQPLTDRAIEFLGRLQHAGREIAGWERHILTLAAPRLREALEQGTITAKWAVRGLLGSLAIKEQDYATAIAVFRAMTEEPGELTGETGPLEQLLAATHYSGNDDEFDAAVGIAFDLLPRLTRFPLRRMLLEQAIYDLLAENRYARGELEDALRQNQRTWELRETLAEHPECAFVTGMLLRTRYQRGCILRKMGRLDDALREMEAVYANYRGRETANRQEIADCLHQIGGILGEKGLAAIGRDPVERAIALYAEIGEAASEAAARGTLGTLLAQQGYIAEARRAYEDGLTFWKSANHPRWVARFEERIARLNDLSDR